MKTTIKTLTFPCEIKNKVKIKTSLSNLKVEFINGHIIKFDKTNLSVQEPHKIIIQGKSNTLIALIYNDTDKIVESKLTELNEIKTNSEYKQDIKTIFNVKENEKLKLKSEYVKRNNVWKKLTSEQKQFIINKYIDEIEFEMDKDYNVIIKNIIFNKNEIENIAYMFRNDCFDVVININNQDVILSNYQNEIDTQKYIKTLRNFYNIKEKSLNHFKLELHLPFSSIFYCNFIINIIFNFLNFIIC